jgi:hypothetical protein
MDGLRKTAKNSVRFKVLAAASMRISVFWVVGAV